MKKNIFIHFASSNYSPKLRESYLKKFLELVNKKIDVYIFYTDQNLEKEYLDKLNKQKIFFTYYNSEKDAKNLIYNLGKENNIIYINTFDENLIFLVNDIKNFINQKTTKDFNIFRNKYLQRKLLLDYNPEYSVKYIEDKIENLDFEKIIKYLDLPFILKPTSGIQSSGVEKINNKIDFDNYKKNYSFFLKNLQNRGYNNETILAEEYIDGKMYSIDYFVDKNGNIKKSLPVEVILGKDIGINDFMNVSRNINQGVLEVFNNLDLNNFIENTVKALKIKNTFIHHEFKVTSKNKIKTIEVNGRIGGFRLEMIDLAYDGNLFELTKENSKDIDKLKNNVSVLFVYPEKKGILKDFNRDLIEKIKNLNSFFRINILEKYIGKEVGLTKDGFGRVCEIVLKNSDINNIKNDYNFIIDNYKKLVILK